jgi:hypothetical protein
VSDGITGVVFSGLDPVQEYLTRRRGERGESLDSVTGSTGS